jgi:enoyl-CoA hydratase
VSEHVQARIDGQVGRIILDRPAALNALDLPMFRAVEDALVAWSYDPRVALVVIRGAGRAFSAGGDIRLVREALLRGDAEYLAALYRSEYGTDAIIDEYPKPYLALIDGYCMGGGMGLAIHGSHRVASEKAALAMPETAIGFFPDVGCTYVFPRLPRRVGWYLGLTGYRMDAADALWCGLATHHVASNDLDALEAALRERDAPVDETLACFAQTTPPSQLSEHAAEIERCFSGPTLAGVIAALEREETPWARETLATLRRMSPTGLTATWSLFTRGAAMALRACLAMEFHAARRMLEAPDFREGVRAVVVDKDRRPAWSPPVLEEVDAAAIDAIVAECAVPANGRIG